MLPGNDDVDTFVVGPAAGALSIDDIAKGLRGLMHSSRPTDRPALPGRRGRSPDLTGGCSTASAAQLISEVHDDILG
jgi:hypothetical protein